MAAESGVPPPRVPWRRTWQRRWLRRAWDWLASPVVDFIRNDGQVYAAAIAFYGVVSLVPLGAVIIAAGGAVLANLGHGNAVDQAALIRDVVAALRKAVPMLPARATEDVLASLVDSRSDLGLFGGVGLVVSASQVVRAMRTALVRIFWGFSPIRRRHVRVTVRANPVVAGLRYVRREVGTSVGVVGLGLLFGSARYLLTAVMSVVRAVAPAAWLHVLKEPVLVFLIGQTSAFLFSFVGYLVLVGYVVRRAASWRAMLLGALVFGGLQAVAESIYGYYVMHLARLSLTYGSMATLVAVALWVFVSSCLFLLSAQLTAEARVWGLSLRQRRRVREVL